MPTLSLYVSQLQICALYYNSPTDFKFAVFPHVYPQSLVYDDTTEAKFYKQVIKQFEEKLEFDIDACDVIVGDVSGRTLPISFGQKQTLSVPVLDALNTVHNYSWLLVEDFFVGTANGGLGFFPGVTNKLEESEIVTYFSNKAIYPQYQSTNPRYKFAHENLIKNIAANTKYTPDPSKTLIFTGGRFSMISEDPVSTYLLAFGLISAPGVYRVKLDIGNKLPLISLLNSKMLGVKNEGSSSKEQLIVLGPDITNVNGNDLFDDEFIDAGTVLKAPGGAEVLFEKEAGNSQFMELKKDQMFIFPLNVGESARVSINGKNIGKIDTHVRGGQLGFVLDGRDYQYDSINKDWVRVFKERVEAF